MCWRERTIEKMQSQRMSRFVKSFDSKKFRQRDIDLRDILDILTCFLICNKFYLIQIRGVDVFLENLFTCTICEKVSFCFISKPSFHFFGNFPPFSRRWLFTMVVIQCLFKDLWRWFEETHPIVHQPFTCSWWKTMSRSFGRRSRMQSQRMPR